MVTVRKLSASDPAANMNTLERELPKISVRNLQRSAKVDLSGLRRFAGEALAACLNLPRRRPTDLDRARAIAILIVSDRRIASLHQRFLDVAGSTDVLTFQHGEILISAETAHRHARRFSTSLPRELRLYILHGLLHLHGFDDTTPVAKREMESVQRKIFRRLEGWN